MTYILKGKRVLISGEIIHMSKFKPVTVEKKSSTIDSSERIKHTPVTLRVFFKAGNTQTRWLQQL